MSPTTFSLLRADNKELPNALCSLHPPGIKHFIAGGSPQIAGMLAFPRWLGVCRDLHWRSEVRAVPEEPSVSEGTHSILFGPNTFFLTDSSAREEAGVSKNFKTMTLKAIKSEMWSSLVSSSGNHENKPNGARLRRTSARCRRRTRRCARCNCWLRPYCRPLAKPDVTPNSTKSAWRKRFGSTTCSMTILKQYR